ncbi:hypothetical protein [Cellulomonas sp. NS3]|uniref:hypothetical protein n=1 Tax=Cellulomonas sp. NS3 TaxID=2973977 RepID=UPI0021631B68|nr:hypothetical protein [Cellulomonas sp. NS3]
MASTNPLTDAISQLVSRTNGVVNDPQVRTSVRRLGSDLKGFGGAVVEGWKSARTSTPTAPPQPAAPPSPAPEHPAAAAPPPAAGYPPPAAPPPAAYPPAPEQPTTGYAPPVQPPAEHPGEPYRQQ